MENLNEYACKRINNLMQENLALNDYIRDIGFQWLVQGFYKWDCIPLGLSATIEIDGRLFTGKIMQEYYDDDQSLCVGTVLDITKVFTRPEVDKFINEVVNTIETTPMIINID